MSYTCDCIYVCVSHNPRGGRGNEWTITTLLRWQIRVNKYLSIPVTQSMGDWESFPTTAGLESTDVVFHARVHWPRGNGGCTSCKVICVSACVHWEKEKRLIKRNGKEAIDCHSRKRKINIILMNMINVIPTLVVCWSSSANNDLQSHAMHF